MRRAFQEVILLIHQQVQLHTVPPGMELLLLQQVLQDVTGLLLLLIL